MNDRYTLLMLIAAPLAACGPSYPRGKIVRTQAETVLYYPDPELPSDAATMASLKDYGEKNMKCPGVITDGSLALVCGKITYVFTPNPDSKGVLVGSCLGVIAETVCEQTLKQVIAGRK